MTKYILVLFIILSPTLLYADELRENTVELYQCLIEQYGLKSTNIAIVVVGFKNSKTNKRIYLSDEVEGILSSQISQDHFRPVNRGNIEELSREPRFQHSEIVDETTAKEVGNFLGADLLLTGEFVVDIKKVTIRAKIIDLETSEEYSNCSVTLAKSTIDKSLFESAIADFRAKKGRIRAYSIPDSAEFTLIDANGNQVYRGNSLYKIVPAGKYTIKAKLENYVEKEKNINVRDGSRNDIKFEFTKQDNIEFIKTEMVGTVDIWGSTPMVYYSPKGACFQLPLYIGKLSFLDCSIKDRCTNFYGGVSALGEITFTDKFVTFDYFSLHGGLFHRTANHKNIYIAEIGLGLKFW